MVALWPHLRNGVQSIVNFPRSRCFSVGWLKEGIILQQLIVVIGCCGGLVDIVHCQRIGGARSGQVGRERVSTCSLCVACVCVHVCAHAC